MRIVPRAATSRSPRLWDSSNDEVREGVLAVALEEHSDGPAASVIVERLRRLVRRSNARSIDLHDDVATLNVEVIGDARGHIEYQRALRRSEIPFGTNGRRHGHELELAQHLHFGRGNL